MGYTRSKVKLSEDFDWPTELYDSPSVYNNDSWAGWSQAGLPSYEPQAVAPSSSWSWSDIWNPVRDVLTTGVDIYGRLTRQPVPPPTGTIPPNTGGYVYNPQTGRYELRQAPQPMGAGLTNSPYFWPVVLGAGAFFLLRKR